jgi:hypothetical protein
MLKWLRSHLVRIPDRERENRSHAEMLRHLGYAPDEALLRVRRAQPPKTVEPKA